MPMARWRAFSPGRNRGLIATNPCAKGGKLYHGTRIDKIWDDEDVARFLQIAPPYLRLAMLLAINTGQRQGDLLRLPWSAYDGKTIKLRQRKTGAYVSTPVTDELKAALDAAPRQSPIILTNSERKPWSESEFPGAWGKTTVRAGVRGLTFHDLRGTAVVMLARALESTLAPRLALTVGQYDRALPWCRVECSLQLVGDRGRDIYAPVFFWRNLMVLPS